MCADIASNEYRSALGNANYGSANVSILLGNGDGTFQAAVNFDAGMSNPTSLAMGDFNHDGKLDLVAFYPSPNVFGGLDAASLTILLGNGDGSFRAPNTTVLGAAIDLAVGDFNLDHKADVAVIEYDQGSASTRVLILIGNGDGTFQSPKQSAVFPLGFGYLVVTDFNNDGKPDLAIGVLVGVSILIGKGDGTFQVGPDATVGDGFEVQRVRAGDINRDGKLPAACGSSNSVPPPSAQSYTVTVTATSGAIQHSTNVMVTVE